MYHESDPSYVSYPTLKRLHGKICPDWEGYPVWQTGLSTLEGHPTYLVNVIQLKLEII